jgi:hypothetical protein
MQELQSVLYAQDKQIRQRSHSQPNVATDLHRTAVQQRAPAALPRRTTTTSARQMGHTRLLRSHESTHGAWNPCSQPGSTRHRSPAWNASRHTAQSPPPALLSSWHGSTPSSSADRPSAAALLARSSSRGAALRRRTAPRLSAQTTMRTCSTSITTTPATRTTTDSTVPAMHATRRSVSLFCLRSPNTTSKGSSSRQLKVNQRSRKWARESVF